MASIAKKRIQNVFENTQENIRNGQNPNVSGEMRKQGYAPSSCKTLQVMRTTTWAELSMKYLDDKRALRTLYELSGKKNEDKDNRLKASIEVLKLKDRYPKQDTKVINLFTAVGRLKEDEDKPIA